MGYITGKDKNQFSLIPKSLDDMISIENPIRVIDKFIDTLNIRELGFANAVLNPKGGQSPFDPTDMLKLYMYCYNIKIRSSRRIMAECKRNIEIMWLINELVPDFRTISNFRSDNKDSIKKVFIKFVEFSMKIGLIKGDNVFTDGTKIKAQNSKSRNFTKATIEVSLKKITNKIDEYLNELDENDENEKPLDECNLQEINKKIENLNNKKEELEGYKKQMKDTGETQVSLTDSECRRMKLSKGGFDTCFNVQAVVDEEHDLIVEFEVTNECNDMLQLENMTNKAKKTLNKETISNTADKGYANHEEIFYSLMNGDIPNIFPPKGQDFYEYEFDRCNIPQSIKKQCEIKYVGNTVKLKFYPDKALLKKRKAKVEHPFGTIKFWDGASYILTKGKAKTTAEIALSFLSYNFRRVINILGVQKCIEALN